MTHPNGSSKQTLSTRQIVFYALPRFGSMMMFLMVAVYLPKFYTDTLLLAPAFVGWTFLIGRIWDGVTDPMMGHISDKTKLGMGRRRPYFLISAVPIGIAFYLLWSPPEALKDWTLFLYLTVAYLLAFTCYTMFSIPHNALGAELTMDYHERTVLTGAREVFGMAGVLCGSIAPVVFVAIYGGARRGYSYLSVITGSITMLFILLCFFNTRENPEFQRRRPVAMKEGLKAFAGNRPFRLLVVTLVMAFIGHAFIPLMTPYLADYVIQTPWIIPHVVIAYALGSAVSVFFWIKLSRRIGKKGTISSGFILSVVVYSICFYRFHEGAWLDWIFLAVFAGAGQGCSIAIAPSMIADSVDLDELETGRRREGAYFGVWSFIDKSGIGIAVFIALQFLDLVGYVPNQEQTARVYWTIKSLFCLVPAACFVVAFLLLRKYPITKQEHDRIRAEIEAKNASSNELT